MLSWYDGIDLAGLRSIRSDSPYYTDEAAKKELEKKACELLDYAGVHAQFFKDVNDPEESDEADAGDNGEGASSDAMDEDPDELLIADMYRQPAPSTDTAAAGATPADAPPDAAPSASGIN